MDDITYHNWQLADKCVNEHEAVQKIVELEHLLNILPARMDHILEIGYYNGGTHWLWKQLAKHVVSIDINHRGKGVITGDSHDPEVIAQVSNTEWDMVFIDGDHTFTSVLLDYINYSRLVKRGGCVGLHDICTTILLDANDGSPCDVDKAWRKIRQFEHAKKFEEIIFSPISWGGIGVIWQ